MIERNGTELDTSPCVEFGERYLRFRLKQVAFEDDSPTYLEAVQVCWAEDDGPARAEFRIEWEGG